MTAKIAKTEYKKELFSLPVKISERLKEYAKQTHRKKSHIVADAIAQYVKENDREKWRKDALSLIGMISENTPDIQEIKANRTDI